MTALTTIFGLMPMAVSRTSLIWIPYAPHGRTMIGGLITTAFLTLFEVPLFYTYFDDLPGHLDHIQQRSGRKQFPRINSPRGSISPP